MFPGAYVRTYKTDQLQKKLLDCTSFLKQVLYVIYVHKKIDKVRIAYGTSILKFLAWNTDLNFDFVALREILTVPKKLSQMNMLILMNGTMRQ